VARGPTACLLPRWPSKGLLRSKRPAPSRSVTLRILVRLAPHLARLIIALTSQSLLLRIQTTLRSMPSRRLNRYRPTQTIRRRRSISRCGSCSGQLVSPRRLTTSTASSLQQGPHPFEIPELRELILNHVPVDLAFNASVLRVNRAFYGHFHPRLYRSVNLTGPSRQPIKFLESLEARPTETLDAISIGSLLFRLRDDDRTEDFLRRLGKLLRRSAPFAKAIKSLSIFLTCPEDPDDDWEDASQLADVVAACPGLGRLILKQWVTHEFYNSLCARLLACHPTAVFKRLEDLVVEIPAEPFLFRARHVLPSPPKVKTIRTLLVPPVAAAAPELSVHLLSLLLGWLDGHNKPEAQTLVIGSGLMTWLGGKSSSALNRLEIALAQRLVKERGSDLGCRVVWPKSLDLAALLDRDPVFQEVGLMGTVDLWRENVWPEIWAPLVMDEGAEVVVMNIQGPLLPFPAEPPLAPSD